MMGPAMTGAPMRVGVLTGGGDAPGLNAAICGLGLFWFVVRGWG